MNTELKVTSNLQGLARRLVEEDILDSASAEKACQESSRKNKTLLGWLISNSAADPGLLAMAAAEEYGIPLIDIRATRRCPFTSGAISCLSRSRIRPIMT
jgi:type IV pilus assembly protein PilB